jgi:hypothetical protein
MFRSRYSSNVAGRYDGGNSRVFSNKMEPLAEYKVSEYGPTETPVGDKLPY